jgi:AcrR family transcriptional regulator
MAVDMAQSDTGTDTGTGRYGEPDSGLDLKPLAGTHRERKKLATRRAISEAAFHLVEEHGLSGVTVEAISERAGVAPRTFWAYFAAKEDAVLDRDPDRPESLRLAILARPVEEDTLTALRLVLEADMQARSFDRQVAVRKGRLIRQEPHLMAAVAAMFDEIERALVKGVGERIGLDPESALYPGVMVSAACGAMRVAHVRWSNLGAGADLSQIIDDAFAYLASGMTDFHLERTAQ